MKKKNLLRASSYSEMNTQSALKVRNEFTEWVYLAHFASQTCGLLMTWNQNFFMSNHAESIWLDGFANSKPRKYLGTEFKTHSTAYDA